MEHRAPDGIQRAALSNALLAQGAVLLASPIPGVLHHSHALSESAAIFLLSIVAISSIAVAFFTARRGLSSGQGSAAGPIRTFVSVALWGTGLFLCSCASLTSDGINVYSGVFVAFGLLFTGAAAFTFLKVSRTVWLAALAGTALFSALWIPGLDAWWHYASDQMYTRESAWTRVRDFHAWWRQVALTSGRLDWEHSHHLISLSLFMAVFAGGLSAGHGLGWIVRRSSRGTPGGADTAAVDSSILLLPVLSCALLAVLGALFNPNYSYMLQSFGNITHFDPSGTITGSFAVILALWAWFARTRYAAVAPDGMAEGAGNHAGPEAFYDQHELAGKLDSLDLERIPESRRQRALAALMTQGNWRRALELLERRGRDRWDQEDYSLFFQLCGRMKNHRPAKLAFDRVVSGKPLSRETAALYYGYALCCEHAGKNKEAQDIYADFIASGITYKDVASRYREHEAGTATQPPKDPPQKATLAPESSPPDRHATVASAKPGRLAGKYDLVRVLGQGGMGVVYEGVNLGLNKKVAIKKLRDEIRLSRRDRDRFLKEARICAALHHPNIVDIYDILEEDGGVFLVFEYVEGKTLDALLDERRGPLEWSEALRILEPVCEGIGHAHSKRIVHRDLKPSNIILGDGGTVKVMDFGIAREAKNTFTRLTGTKETSGTIAYMAPEQHLGSGDHRVDVYSMGATLYEMLTGEVPFGGADPYEQKRQMAFRPATELNAGLPVKVDAVLARCLHCDTARRYASMSEFLQAVRTPST